MIDLQAYGWSPRLEEAFAPFRAQGRIAGRISHEHTHIYRTVTERGEVLARVAGRLRHQATARVDFPAVGDWVVLDPSAHEGDARIHAVLPRVSRFSRRAAGDVTEEQIVAANIDTIFLVGGLDHDFNPRRMERYLVVAWDSGATPVIVLNKADLASDPEAAVIEMQALAPAVPVYAVSCRDARTLEPLRGHLGVGRTGALLGSSGVGKSTIVNTLAGKDLLRTNDVRESDSRGRHTSTGRQLVLLEGLGLLLDTPGMRELQLWDAGGMTDTFADIEALSEQCRFRDCRHRGEPGCHVASAVESGELPAVRLASFHKLAAEREFADRQQDERAQIEQKRRGKIGAKALSNVLKLKGRS